MPVSEIRGRNQRCDDVGVAAGFPGSRLLGMGITSYILCPKIVLYYCEYAVQIDALYVLALKCNVVRIRHAIFPHGIFP